MTRRSRLLPLVALGLLVAAATAWAQRLAWSTTTYANDELWGTVGARLLERDFLGQITNTGYFNRGPERMISVVQVLPYELWASAPGALRASHVVVALIYFLGAVPTFALARGVGLTRWPAVLVAALAIVTPWVVFGATLLTVTVGFTATMIFAWAAWRAATRPSLLNDVVVLAAAVLNVLCRTGHAPFVVVALLAVMYGVWLRRPDGESRGRSLLRLPVRTARTHPLLVGAFALGAVAVGAIGTTVVVGSAYSMSGDITFPWQSIHEHTTAWFAQLTMATGYLPVIVGVAWMFKQIVRPRAPETGVFAVVAVGLFLVFSYSSGNSFSVLEERYVAVLAGLPAVAFGAALFRREAWPLGTLVVGLLAARAIATWGIYTGEPNAPSDSYVPYQIGPGRMFFSGVILPRLGVALPGPDTRMVLIATLLIVAVAVAVALLVSSRRLPRVPVALAVAVPVLLLGAGSGVWAMEKYKARIVPEATLEQMAWIDDATRGGQAFVWSHFDEQTRGGRVYMNLLGIYFNRSTCCTLWLNDVQEIVGDDGELPGEPTEYLVRFPGYVPLAFESRPVAFSRLYGAEGQRVERFADGPRAALEIEWAELDGTFSTERPVVLKTFSQAREPGKCVDLEVLGTEDLRRPVEVTVGDEVTKTVRRGDTTRFTVPLGGAAAVEVKAAGTPAGLRMGEVAVRRCAGR